MTHLQSLSFKAGGVVLAMIAAGTSQGQTLNSVLVLGQPIPAIYDVQTVGPPGNQFSISAIAFPSGNMLPAAVRNAIQWTDPPQAPPNVSPPIYFYQFNDPQGTIDLSQIQIGNLFGAMGFIDGAINLNQPPGMATFNIPPQTPPGNVPNDPIQRAAGLGGPAPFQNTIIYHDPQPVPNGLRNAIVVGLALPGTLTTTRDLVIYGQADPQTEPSDPNAPGGNGEFAYVPGPAVPDPCIDESLITQGTLDYLKEQETANGVGISSETEVVNFQTVRDQIVAVTVADNGFTYVTVVEDFVTKAFYRFPTGTVDPKGFVPAPADFDEDGDVDGPDLAAWSGGFGAASGATHATGDANGDGAADGFDFLEWQREFGLPDTATHGVAEPNGNLLVALGALGVACCRVRRAR